MPPDLPSEWATRCLDLRARLAEIEATGANTAIVASVRAELARYEALLAGAYGTGPEQALCIACGIATANPDAHLVAERGEEADIELVTDGPDVREWPVLRRKSTAHLGFNRFVLCRVCDGVRELEEREMT